MKDRVVNEGPGSGSCRELSCDAQSFGRPMEGSCPRARIACAGRPLHSHAEAPASCYRAQRHVDLESDALPLLQRQPARTQPGECAGERWWTMNTMMRNVRMISTTMRDKLVKMNVRSVDEGRNCEQGRLTEDTIAKRTTPLRRSWGKRKVELTGHKTQSERDSDAQRRAVEFVRSPQGWWRANRCGALEVFWGGPAERRVNERGVQCQRVDAFGRRVG